MRRRLRHALVAIAALVLPAHLMSCSSAQQGDEQLEATNEGEDAAAQEGEEGAQNAESQEGSEQGNETNVANEEQSNVEGENTANLNESEGEGQSPEEIQEIIADMNQTQTNNPEASSTEAAPIEGQDLVESGATAPDASAPFAAATPAAGSAGPALPEFGSKMPYIIQSGDTLAKISQKVYGQPGRWADIAELSSLPNPSRIFPGDVVYYQLTEETLAFATKYEGLPRQEVVVGAGDTLTSISARVYGSPMDWKILWRHNDNVQDPDRLNPGTVLINPNTSGISAKLNANESAKLALNQTTQPTLTVMEMTVQVEREAEKRFESKENLFDFFSTYAQKDV
jgi:nucleoid-associated protein YgaU